MGTSDLKGASFFTAAYWGFTLTDGALRMLVLLHFHARGISPLELAVLFLVYEAVGLVINPVGGWLAARFGLRLTLVSGLALQVVALLLLSALQPDWSVPQSIAWIMGMQALSGIAKDLTKVSAKSGLKGRTDSERTLFRWVALLTGSKNALKGAGFFLGGFLLGAVGFVAALWIMATGLLFVLVAVLFLLPAQQTPVHRGHTFGRLFSRSQAVNVLSFARVFLFGSRDLWFVVGLPLYLKDALDWSFSQVGGFMAVWVIGYGLVQAIAPRLMRTDSTCHAARALRLWSSCLFVVPLGIGLALLSPSLASLSTFILIGGLFLYGFVFAVNSSLHSGLIVGYADAGDVTLSVGFYYMANAAGRLIGTLLSGLVFMWAGLEGCLLVSALFVALATFISLFLPTAQTS